MSDEAQYLNFVSVVTAAAVDFALAVSASAVLIVFGIWIGLAGVLQLSTTIGRWKIAGAQWGMILSGSRSALASALGV